MAQGGVVNLDTIWRQIQRRLPPAPPAAPAAHPPAQPAPRVEDKYSLLRGKSLMQFQNESEALVAHLRGSVTRRAAFFDETKAVGDKAKAAIGVAKASALEAEVERGRQAISSFYQAHSKQLSTLSQTAGSEQETKEIQVIQQQLKASEQKAIDAFNNALHAAVIKTANDNLENTRQKAIKDAQNNSALREDLSRWWQRWWHKKPDEGIYTTSKQRLPGELLPRIGRGIEVEMDFTAKKVTLKAKHSGKPNLAKPDDKEYCEKLVDEYIDRCLRMGGKVTIPEIVFQTSQGEEPLPDVQKLLVRRLVERGLGHLIENRAEFADTISAVEKEITEPLANIQEALEARPALHASLRTLPEEVKRELGLRDEQQDIKALTDEVVSVIQASDRNPDQPYPNMIDILNPIYYLGKQIETAMDEIEALDPTQLKSIDPNIIIEKVVRPLVILHKTKLDDPVPDTQKRLEALEKRVQVCFSKEWHEELARTLLDEQNTIRALSDTVCRLATLCADGAPLNQADTVLLQRSLQKLVDKSEKFLRGLDRLPTGTALENQLRKDPADTATLPRDITPIYRFLGALAITSLSPAQRSGLETDENRKLLDRLEKVRTRAARTFPNHWPYAVFKVVREGATQASQLLAHVMNPAGAPALAGGAPSYLQQLFNKVQRLTEHLDKTAIMIRGRTFRPLRDEVRDFIRRFATAMIPAGQLKAEHARLQATLGSQFPHEWNTALAKAIRNEDNPPVNAVPGLQSLRALVDARKETLTLYEEKKPGASQPDFRPVVNRAITIMTLLKRWSSRFSEIGAPNDMVDIVSPHFLKPLADLAVRNISIKVLPDINSVPQLQSAWKRQCIEARQDLILERAGRANHFFSEGRRDLTAAFISITAIVNQLEKLPAGTPLANRLTVDSSPVSAAITNLATIPDSELGKLDSPLRGQYQALQADIKKYFPDSWNAALGNAVAAEAVPPTAGVVPIDRLVEDIKKTHREKPGSANAAAAPVFYRLNKWVPFLKRWTNSIPDVDMRNTFTPHFLRPLARLAVRRISNVGLNKYVTDTPALATAWNEQLNLAGQEAIQEEAAQANSAYSAIITPPAVASIAPAPKSNAELFLDAAERIANYSDEMKRTDGVINDDVRDFLNHFATIPTEKLIAADDSSLTARYDALQKRIAEHFPGEWNKKLDDAISAAAFPPDLQPSLNSLADNARRELLSAADTKDPPEFTAFVIRAKRIKSLLERWHDQTTPEFTGQAEVLLSSLATISIHENELRRLATSNFDLAERYQKIQTYVEPKLPAGAWERAQTEARKAAIQAGAQAGQAVPANNPGQFFAHAGRVIYQWGKLDAANRDDVRNAIISSNILERLAAVKQLDRLGDQERRCYDAWQAAISADPQLRAAWHRQVALTFNDEKDRLSPTLDKIKPAPAESKPLPIAEFENFLNTAERIVNSLCESKSVPNGIDESRLNGFIRQLIAAPSPSLHGPDAEAQILTPRFEQLQQDARTRFRDIAREVGKERENIAMIKAKVPTIEAIFGMQKTDPDYLDYLRPTLTEAKEIMTVLENLSDERIESADIYQMVHNRFLSALAQAPTPSDQALDGDLQKLRQRAEQRFQGDWYSQLPAKSPEEDKGRELQPLLPKTAQDSSRKSDAQRATDRQLKPLDPTATR